MRYKRNAEGIVEIYLVVVLLEMDVVIGVIRAEKWNQNAEFDSFTMG